jgi:hypothetical protein
LALGPGTEEASGSNRERLLKDRIDAGEAAGAEKGVSRIERTMTGAKGMNHTSAGDGVRTKPGTAFDRIRLICANQMHRTQDRIPVNRALHESQADFGLILSGCLSNYELAIKRLLHPNGSASFVVPMANRSRKTKVAGPRASPKVIGTSVRVQDAPPWYRRDWLWGLILILLVILTYLPVWKAGFVWDDETILTANPCIVAPLGLREIWTTRAADICPLTLTTFLGGTCIVGIGSAAISLGERFVARSLRDIAVAGAANFARAGRVACRGALGPSSGIGGIGGVDN